MYCALVAEDVRHGLLLAVNHSGDSDSTGAICGNLLGTLHGETALPPVWLVELEGRETILQLADDFSMEMTQGPALHGPAGSSPGWLARYRGPDRPYGDGPAGVAGNGRRRPVMRPMEGGPQRGGPQGCGP